MAAPTISSINPTNASPGQKVIITGTNFTTATAVQFGGFDALLFIIQSSTIIWAYAPIQGTGTVAVVNPNGTATVSGYYAVLTRIRLPDLPVLGRPIDPLDKTYIWDYIRNILCQAPIGDLPANGGGGGGGGGGNIYTALGSPFKVRTGDANHSYDAGTNSTTITDVRLLGKNDYVVSATDISNEWENDRLTFDPIAGSVTISNYQLTTGRHITIYADGVVTSEFNAYITKLKDQIDTLLMATAPFLPSLNAGGTLSAPGGLIAWFRPANEIPTGWSEWVPGRGCVLVGQDTSGDLSAENGTGGGGDGIQLTEDNIPKIQLKMFSGATQAGQLYPDPSGAKSVAWSSNHVAGNQDYDMRGASDDNPSLGHTSSFGKVNPDPIGSDIPLNPYRIVNFIYSTITP